MLDGVERRHLVARTGSEHRVGTVAATFASLAAPDAALERLPQRAAATPREPGRRRLGPDAFRPRAEVIGAYVGGIWE